jgi:hypothetical protein
MKTEKFHSRMIAGVVLGGALTFTKAFNAQAATVVVSPTTLNGWELGSFDYDATTNTTYPDATAGTEALVPGPATPPAGIGSAELATNPGRGDSGSVISTDNFNGDSLGSITALNYYAYDVNNNGQQFPYLAVNIYTGSVDNSGDSGALADTYDTLFFEPPYQQGSEDGNPSITAQEDTQTLKWQQWDAYAGAWWDNNNVASPGAAGGPGSPGVMSLATFVTDFPDATIASTGVSGLGSVAFQVGFGSPTDSYLGYVDDFTIGINNSNTTYDFEPVAVPEPASFSLIGVGAALLMRRRRKTRIPSGLRLNEKKMI